MNLRIAKKIVTRDGRSISIARLDRAVGIVERAIRRRPRAVPPWLRSAYGMPRPSDALRRATRCLGRIKRRELRVVFDLIEEGLAAARDGRHSAFDLGDLD